MQRSMFSQSQYPTSSYTPSPIGHTVPSLPATEPNQDSYSILHNWIRSRSSLPLSKPVNQRFASEISIPVYKQLRRHCNDVITETNKQTTDLEKDMHTLSWEDWCEKKEEIDCTITKINKIADVISHPKVTKGIQQRINRGRKKRAKYSRSRSEDSIEAIRRGIGPIGSKSSSSKRLEIENVDKLLSGIVKLRNLRRSDTESLFDASSLFEEKVRDFQDRLSKQKKTVLSDQRTDASTTTT